MRFKDRRFLIFFAGLIVVITVFSFFYIFKKTRCSQVLAEYDVNNEVVINLDRDVCHSQFDLALAVKLQSLLSISSFKTLITSENKIFDGENFIESGMAGKKNLRLIEDLKKSKANERAVFLNFAVNDKISGNIPKCRLYYDGDSDQSMMLAYILEDYFFKILKFSSKELETKPLSRKADNFLNFDVPVVFCEFNRSAIEKESEYLGSDKAAGRLSLAVYAGILRFYGEKSARL